MLPLGTMDMGLSHHASNPFDSCERKDSFKCIRQKRDGTWKASFRGVLPRKISLGIFQTVEEAIMAYKRAEKFYGRADVGSFIPSLPESPVPHSEHNIMQQIMNSTVAGRSSEYAPYLQAGTMPPQTHGAPGGPPSHTMCQQSWHPLQSSRRSPLKAHQQGPGHQKSGQQTGGQPYAPGTPSTAGDADPRPLPQSTQGIRAMHQNYGTLAHAPGSGTAFEQIPRGTSSRPDPLQPAESCVGSTAAASPAVNSPANTAAVVDTAANSAQRQEAQPDLRFAELAASSAAAAAQVISLEAELAAAEADAAKKIFGLRQQLAAAKAAAKAEKRRLRAALAANTASAGAATTLPPPPNLTLTRHDFPHNLHVPAPTAMPPTMDAAAAEATQTPASNIDQAAHRLHRRKSSSSRLHRSLSMPHSLLPTQPPLMDWNLWAMYAGRHPGSTQQWHGLEAWQHLQPAAAAAGPSADQQRRRPAALSERVNVLPPSPDTSPSGSEHQQQAARSWPTAPPPSHGLRHAPLPAPSSSGHEQHPAQSALPYPPPHHMPAYLYPMHHLSSQYPGYPEHLWQPKTTKKRKRASSDMMPLPSMQITPPGEPEPVQLPAPIRSPASVTLAQQVVGTADNTGAMQPMQTCEAACHTTASGVPAFHAVLSDPALKASNGFAASLPPAQLDGGATHAAVTSGQCSIRAAGIEPPDAAAALPGAGGGGQAGRGSCVAAAHCHVFTAQDQSMMDMLRSVLEEETKDGAAAQQGQAGGVGSSSTQHGLVLLHEEQHAAPAGLPIQQRPYHREQPRETSSAAAPQSSGAQPHDWAHKSEVAAAAPTKALDVQELVPLAGMQLKGNWVQEQQQQQQQQGAHGSLPSMQHLLHQLHQSWAQSTSLGHSGVNAPSEPAVSVQPGSQVPSVLDTCLIAEEELFDGLCLCGDIE